MSDPKPSERDRELALAVWAGWNDTEEGEIDLIEYIAQAIAKARAEGHAQGCGGLQVSDLKPSERDREDAKKLVLAGMHLDIDTLFDRVAVAFARKRAEERAWWNGALKEAERQLCETPECGHSLVEDAWPFLEVLQRLIEARGASDD